MLSQAHSMGVLAALMMAILGGTAGAALGLWLESWLGKPRPRPHIIGQYQCPHGFATVAACPTCSHFAQVGERER